MRFIKAELPAFYEKVVLDVLGRYSEANTIDKDFFRDLIYVIAQGYDAMWQILITVPELFQGAMQAYLKGKVKNMRIYESELFMLRMDLVDFADSGFARALKVDPFLKIEEKFELVVLLVDELMQQVPKDIKREMKDRMQENSGISSGGEGSQSGESGQPGGAGGEVPTREDKAMVANFFKGFSFLSNNLFEKNGGLDKEFNGFSRGVSAIDRIKKAAFEDKMKISDLVNDFWNRGYLKMFEIAHNIELVFKGSKIGKMEDTDSISSNLTIKKMNRFKDLKRALNMDMAMDNDVLDRKIMSKGLKVRKFRERKDKKQFLYALLDKSGSMDHHYDALGINRIQFVQAIAIALGKKAVSDGSKFYFRWFDGGVQNVYKLTNSGQWPKFLNAILDTAPGGSTDIDLAMHTSVGDMNVGMAESDKSDMIIITDGTQDLEELDEFMELKSRGARFHFICLEDLVRLKGRTKIERLAETFQVVDLDKVKSFADYNPEFRKVI